MVSAAGHRRALGLPLPYHKLQGGPPGYSCVREAPSVIHRALSPKATRWGSVGGSGPAFQKAPPACFTLWSTGHPPPQHTPTSSCPWAFASSNCQPGMLLPAFWVLSSETRFFHVVGKAQASVHLCRERHHLIKACRTSSREEKALGVVTWIPTGTFVQPLV